MSNLIGRPQTDVEQLLVRCIQARVKPLQVAPTLERKTKQLTAGWDPWNLRLVSVPGATHSSRRKSRAALEAGGCELQDNVFEGEQGRYLPLYDVESIRPFDHRSSIHFGYAQAMEAGEVPPSMLEPPRAWVSDRLVVPDVAELPSELVHKYYAGDKKSISRILGYEAVSRALYDGRDDVAGAIFDRLMNVGMTAYNVNMQWLACHRSQPETLLTSAEFARIALLGDEMKAAEYLIERRTPRWLTVLRVIPGKEGDRRLASTVIPLAAVGCGLQVVLTRGRTARQVSCLIANLNSLVVNFVASTLGHEPGPRTSIGYLSALEPSACVELERLIAPRVLELVYTAHDLRPFAESMGYHGPPFRWDEERRFQIRCELEAAFFHLYLPADKRGHWCPATGEQEELAQLTASVPTPRDAVERILDTFPIVKRKDEKAHGEYRTKRVILEIYDEMAEAMKQGSGNRDRGSASPTDPRPLTPGPYRTRLDPPPGPPADAEGNFLPLPEWLPGQSRPADWPTHIHGPKEVYDWAKQQGIDWCTLLKPNVGGR